MLSVEFLAPVEKFLKNLRDKDLLIPKNKNTPYAGVEIPKISPFAMVNISPAGLKMSDF
ncbi:MAG: hypothetical protein WA118_04930 [Carboxydocellales bacterium]|jgi:hypothetical protein